MTRGAAHLRRLRVAVRTFKKADGIRRVRVESPPVKGATARIVPRTEENGRAHGPQIRARPFASTVEQPASVENLLTRDYQERLNHLASLIQYSRRGARIYSEGENAQFLYFVERGIVRTFRCAEDGRRRILAFRGPGDVLGLPDGGRYANSSETVGPCRIYHVPWLRMSQMLSAEPQLRQVFLEKVSFDLRQAETRLVVLGQQNVYQRLASFILELISAKQDFGAKNSSVRVPVSRFDIADYICAAPENAARAFSKLQAEGLLRRVNARTLDVLDVQGLVAIQRRRREHKRRVVQAPCDSLY
jgi:CRP/FNR family transcriptional regulator, anaerobic regulatory protein